MSSAQESKLPFIILIPFVLLVLAIAWQAGAPSTPQMPGVSLPVAPVVSAPVVAAPAAAPAAGEAAPAAPTEAPAAESAAQENWE
ncbi:MAG TPA: hypothetical protein VM901_07430 [Bdellovibrionota bacterium]|nr:hypothetical protein [Bdellovibrionota bacterium]